MEQLDWFERKLAEVHQEVRTAHDQMKNCRKGLRDIDKYNGAFEKDEESLIRGVSAAGVAVQKGHEQLIDLVHHTQDHHIRAEKRFEANESWLSLHDAADCLAQAADAIAHMPQKLERFDKKYNPFPEYSDEIEQTDKILSMLSDCLESLGELNRDALKAIYLKELGSAV